LIEKNVFRTGAEVGPSWRATALTARKKPAIISGGAFVVKSSIET
jgi:hypothetical protein